MHVPYDFVAARAFPQLGLTWNYPLAHRGADYTYLIHPTVAGLCRADRRQPLIIPNEDSLGYEFRDSDLFRADRMQGYDLLDTGQRVDYGLNLGAYAQTAATTGC